MPGKSDFEKASFGGEEKREKRARGGGKGEEEVSTCHYLIGIFVIS